MALECPNCRESVSFIRALRTTAWGSFRCGACGSILGISLARRVMGAGVWIVLLVTTSEILQLYRYGRLWSYAIMVVSLLLFLYIFEHVVLLERRGFTCKKCGYDLQGLPENRCPECGLDFDPAERERILARINKPPPRPKRQWIAAIVLVLLVASVVLSMIVYKNTATPAAAPPPPGGAAPPPATNGQAPQAASTNSLAPVSSPSPMADP